MDVTTKPETHPRCMGCGGTHAKCVTQIETERLVHQLAQAIEAGSYNALEAAMEAYDRWA